MNQSSIKILYIIKQTTNFYNKYMARVSDKCGITKQEADILLFLANNPEFDTAKDVVELRGFSKGYVSKAVEMLVDKNLISIIVNKGDRRYQHIVINKEAGEVVKVLQQSQKEYFELLSEGVSREEIDSFISLSEKFAANIKKIEAIEEKNR